MARNTITDDLEKQFTAKAKTARARLEGFVGTAATLSKWNSTLTEAQCFEAAAKMARAHRQLGGRTRNQATRNQSTRGKTKK